MYLIIISEQIILLSRVFSINWMIKLNDSFMKMYFYGAFFGLLLMINFLYGKELHEENIYFFVPQRKVIQVCNNINVNES